MFWVLTPIASKHNGNYESENIHKLIVARLQWTKQANRMNEPNSNELKHSPVKLNPTLAKRTKSQHPSLLSNLEFCDLSICSLLLNLLCLFCMLSCEPLLWFANMSIGFELLWHVCTFCSTLIQRLCLNIDCWLSYRWLPIFFLGSWLRVYQWLSRSLTLFGLFCLTIILRFLFCSDSFWNPTRTVL